MIYIYIYMSIAFFSALKYSVVTGILPQQPFKTKLF
jgi:hypothetical protein